MFNTYFKEKKDQDEDNRGTPTGIAALVRLQTEARGRKRCGNDHGVKPVVDSHETLAGEDSGLDKGGQ